ncbi:hypothetical protein BJX76DRAFT_359605 [Aspergillus varians]
MLSNPSSSLLSSADAHRISSDEIRKLCSTIDEEKKHKSLALVFVCHARASVDCLKDKYRSAWYRPSNKRIILTTASNIDKALSRASKQAGRKQKLMLLVSPYVASISFDISSSFHMVTIYRCGNISRKIKAIKAEDHLLIDDASTFCNVMLRKWEDRPKRLRNRQISLLAGAYLCLNLDRPNINPDMLSLSNDDKAKLAYTMSRLDMSVTDEPSFWDQWKGVIATLLGATAGVMKFDSGIKITGAGIYCSHWFGVKLFGGYLSTSAYISAAVPAVGLALGTVAAVYFIPWDKLWTFFQRLVGKVWDTLGQIWEWVKEKLSSVSRVMEDLPPPPAYSMAT